MGAYYTWAPVWFDMRSMQAANVPLPMHRPQVSNTRDWLHSVRSGLNLTENNENEDEPESEKDSEHSESDEPDAESDDEKGGSEPKARVRWADIVSSDEEDFSRASESESES